MMNDDEKRIIQKLDFFMQEKIPVHVQLKNKSFLNGRLIKIVDEGVYWLEEFKYGETYLFISDVFEVNEFRRSEK